MFSITTHFLVRKIIAPRRNANELHLVFIVVLQVLHRLLARMTPFVHRNPQRFATELIFVTIHHLRKHRRLRRTLFIENTIRDKLFPSLRDENQMTQFNRLVLLSLLDQFRIA